MADLPLRSLSRPAPPPGVFAAPDPIEAFVTAMDEAERERTLADLRLSPGPVQR